jgi:hypothetical protein
MKDELGEIPSWDVYRNTRQWLKDHIVEYRNTFNAAPIVNHMSQWPVWAEKFLNSDDEEKKILANMLMYSLKDKEECLVKFRKESAKFNAVFFAFIETVDRLPVWARWAVRAPKVEDEAKSLGGAWSSIKQLNEWRRTNKHNIKYWDPS